MAVIILTTGAPGTGKSYSRVRSLMRDYLANNTGIYITNISLNCQAIAEYMSKKTGKETEYYLNRLHVIPPEELSAWMNLTDKGYNQKEGSAFRPVEYLNRFDLTNAHIAIDEFHLYFNKNCSTVVKKQWNDWFAEIRKTGCTFEAITQDMSLFPREFTGKIGQRIDLLPYADVRDPFFAITMYDWYELRAGYTGIVEQKVCQTEYNKGTSFTGGVKWKKNHVEVFTISSEYYSFYNSYQRNDNQTTGKSVTPHERYGKKIIFWFLKRNFWSLFKRLVIVVFFCWLTFGGGLLWGINLLTTTLAKMASANSGSPVTTAKKPGNHAVKSSSAPGPTVSHGVSQANTMNQAYSGDSVQAVPVLSGKAYNADDYKPSMFFKDCVWLRNGIRIEVDYQFTEGIYEGKFVDEISFTERYYVLDDGTTVRMF